MKKQGEKAVVTAHVYVKPGPRGQGRKWGRGGSGAGQEVGPRGEWGRAGSGAEGVVGQGR